MRNELTIWVQKVGDLVFSWFPDPVTLARLEQGLELERSGGI